MLKSIAAATLLTFALGGAAFAAGEANGKWDCSLDDGSALGTLGLDGNNYVFANPNGKSGKGGVLYQAGADAPTLVVLDGALVSVGVLGGWLDASIPETPYLTLVDALGNRVDCVTRP